MQKKKQTQQNPKNPKTKTKKIKTHQTPNSNNQQSKQTYQARKNTQVIISSWESRFFTKNLTYLWERATVL